MNRHRQLRQLVAAASAAAALLCAVPALAAASPARGHPTSRAAASGGLPDWAIGPFTRYKGNPILTPPNDPTPTTQWEFPEAFNPGVVIENGVFHMLYRGATNGDYSQIGAATSTDGHHFSALPSPVITDSLPSETHGVEDPR